MATEAAQLKRKIPGRKRKTNLTHTGLLMEGLGRVAHTSLAPSGVTKPAK
jgi:hypothetical protein